MQIQVGNKYTVELTVPRGLGENQIVRVYRRLLFFRKRLSSDWFLNQGQAERFARKIAAELTARGHGTSQESHLPR
jgi:hypothetical protein